MAANVDMCYKLSLFVLCVSFTGIVNAISNAPITIHQTKAPAPIRRFYLFHPELIPQAAAALNMLIPHPIYHPYHQYNQYPHQLAEQEEVDEYPEPVPTPIQLLTFFKQNQQKKRVKKKKPNGGRVKRVKKGSKKCMPFRVRFIKKSDVGVPSFRRNYVVRRPQRGNSWGRINSWRLAKPGNSVTEFSLQEPIPSVLGGSPPSSPIYNVYEDSRIPLHETFKVPEAVVPNYVHLHESTTTPPYSDNRVESQTEVYSDSDYYRYGIYQNKIQPAVIFRNSTNYDEDYSNHPSTTEKVVTITPTTSWVPIPQYYRVTQTVGNTSGEQERNVTTVFKFGDKIRLSKNCSAIDCRNV